MMRFFASLRLPVIATFAENLTSSFSAKVTTSAIIASLLLSGCSLLPDWLGAEEQEPPLPGERIALKAAEPSLFSDEALEGVEIVIPDMPANAAWPQALGNATGVSGNLKLAENLSLKNEVQVGEGNGYSSPLVPPPVIADGMVFAMDGAGVISAHDAANVSNILWVENLLEVDEEENRLVGGGIAWNNGYLYAAGSEGKVIALEARTGKMKWKQELLLPLRTSPRISGASLLLLTADNQLLSLNRNDGSVQWAHRGMSEIAAPLHAALPAARDNIILVAYSSGELVALDKQSGASLWSDALGSGSTDLRQQSHVSPIMARGLSFGAGPQRIVAYESQNGRRLWERDIPAKSSPWLAGNTLFLLTPNAEMVAMRGTDGGVHWIAKVPEKTEDDEPIIWHGPVVAGNKVWLAGNHGQLLALSLTDGSEAELLEIPEEIMTTPVIANETLYLLDQAATLHVLK